MNRLKIGIAGKRGLAMLSGFRALPQSEVAAFCDADSEVLQREADHHDIPKRFDRFADMLDGVDAVVVATPEQLHVPQAILALSAGKHVLSEVPASIALDDSWRLLDAAKASGATYMMAENYCYAKDIVLIHEMVREGLFGDPYFGEGEYVHEIRQMHRFPDGRPTWRYYWQVGFNGNTYPTHSVGPVMRWMKAADPGERIESVVCLGSGVRTDPEHPHDDTTITLCKLKSGKLIKLRLDMMSNRPHAMNYYTLQGTTGAYESSRIPGKPGIVWIGESRDGEHREWKPLSEFEEHLPDYWRNPSEEALRAGHGGGDFFEVKDFVDAATSGTPPPIDIFDALEWSAIIPCSKTSIENGGVPVRIPDFRDPSRRPMILDAPPAIP